MLVSLMRFFYVLENYYTKIALSNVHDGRIMHRLRCSGIFDKGEVLVKMHYLPLRSGSDNEIFL